MDSLRVQCQVALTDSSPIASIRVACAYCSSRVGVLLRAAHHSSVCACAALWTLQKLVSQQQGAFGGGIEQLDQLLAQLHDMQGQSPVDGGSAEGTHERVGMNKRVAPLCSSARLSLCAHAVLRDCSECLTGDGSSANPQTTLATQAANVSRLATDCRSRLPKEFKALFTNIGKLSSKIDKVIQTARTCLSFFFLSRGHRRNGGADCRCFPR